MFVKVLSFLLPILIISTLETSRYLDSKSFFKILKRLNHTWYSHYVTLFFSFTMYRYPSHIHYKTWKVDHEKMQRRCDFSPIVLQMCFLLYWTNKLSSQNRRFFKPHPMYLLFSKLSLLPLTRRHFLWSANQK